MELLLLLSKCDSGLQKHVTNHIEKSKKQMGSKGRRSFVTMFSKTTVNNLIQQKIAVEVRKAGKFSKQMKTAQELTSKEQCVLVL